MGQTDPRGVYMLRVIGSRLRSALVCCLLVAGLGFVAGPAAFGAAHPSISVSPKPITATNCGSATVSGENFVGGGNVASLSVDGTFEGAADVAPDGTFTISFNACSFASGRHTASVTSSPNGLSASRNFHVK